MKIYTFKHSSKKHSWFCLRKKSLRIRIGNEILLHQTCNFKFLLLQNFSSQSKLLLQWKHFLKINYAMFQTKPKVLLCSKGTGPMKENFIPNSMGRFFLMSRNVWKKTLIPAGSLVWTEFSRKDKEDTCLHWLHGKIYFWSIGKTRQKKAPTNCSERDTKMFGLNHSFVLLI